MTYLFKYPQREFFMSGCPIITSALSVHSVINHLLLRTNVNYFLSYFHEELKNYHGLIKHIKKRKYFFIIIGKLSVFKITTQQMKLRVIHKDKKLKRDTYFELSYYNKIYCGFNTQFLCDNPHRAQSSGRPVKPWSTLLSLGESNMHGTNGSYQNTISKYTLLKYKQANIFLSNLSLQ